MCINVGDVQYNFEMGHSFMFVRSSPCNLGLNYYMYVTFLIF